MSVVANNPLVEILNAQPEHNRPGVTASWRRAVGNDTHKLQLITKAAPFVASGGSEGAAAAQWESY